MQKVSEINNHYPSYPECHDLDGRSFIMRSPAKINLGLRVIGRRQDNYHDLETIFQEISLVDTIEFHASTRWNLECEGADLPLDESNLVNRAAELLSSLCGCQRYGHIVLHKNIPIGGGLGGGSSNATIALFGLSRLWKLDLKQEQIYDLSCKIGSDCAFFVHGGLAKASGRGEILEPLDGCIDGYIVLITPPFSISTAWAFQEGRFPLTNAEKNVILALCSCDFSYGLRELKIHENDFEHIVFSKFKELESIKRKLVSFGAKVSMLTGSGSSIFGIFSEHSQAMRAAQQFGSPYRVFLCQAVQRKRLAVP